MQYQPSAPNVKHIMNKWHLMENQPSLNKTFEEPPLTVYKKGRSLKRYICESKVMRMAKT